MLKYLHPRRPRDSADGTIHNAAHIDELLLIRAAVGGRSGRLGGHKPHHLTQGKPLLLFARNQRVVCRRRLNDRDECRQPILHEH